MNMMSAQDKILHNCRNIAFLSPQLVEELKEFVSPKTDMGMKIMGFRIIKNDLLPPNAGLIVDSKGGVTIICEEDDEYEQTIDRSKT